MLAQGIAAFESQKATSGMEVTHLSDGTLVCGCNDLGLEPDFKKLRFRLRIEPPGGW